MVRLAIAYIVSLGLFGSPILAAEDLRILTGSQRDSGRSTGMGAQASVRIKFGEQKTRRKSDDIALTFAAGPSFARSNGDGLITRRGVSGLASFTLRPGYSTTLSMAGQPLVQRYTARGLAEARASGLDPKGKRKGVSTLGWVGIGVGVFVVAIGVLAIACENTQGGCIGSE